ncbi:MAG: hypothetical protein ABI811_03620 [Acidobacteriota bacterium]
MRVNLDSLGREILAHLEERGIAVFKSYPRTQELGSDAIYWDTADHPDYREFIAAAVTAGIRLVTLYRREFSPEIIDDAMQQLAESSLDRDTRRSIEGRLRELRAYEGFICQIELSFGHAQRTYIFDQSTEWYDEMTELLEQIEDSFHTSGNENPLTGYYSNN